MLFSLGLMNTAGAYGRIPLKHVVVGSTHGGNGKSPIQVWDVEQEGNILTMTATPCDYTLNLYDEDGDVVYTAFIPAGTSSVILPATLSGDFEIRFETDTYYYYGFISL